MFRQSGTLCCSVAESGPISNHRTGTGVDQRSTCFELKFGTLADGLSWFKACHTSLSINARQAPGMMKLSFDSGVLSTNTLLKMKVL